MIVREIMDTDIVTVRPATTLREVFAIMKQYDLGEFPVVDENHELEGMIYENDLLRVLDPDFEIYMLAVTHDVDLETSTNLEGVVNRIQDTAVTTLMKRDVHYVPSNALLMKAAGILMERKRPRMPVVDENNKVVGMISQQKLFTVIMDHFLTEMPEQKKKAQEAWDKEREALRQRQYKGPENRLYDRVNVRVQVAYKLTNSEGKPLSGEGRIGWTLDLSAGGLRVRTDEELPVNSVLELAFQLPNTQTPIKRLARVCRSVMRKDKKYESGIMFLALSVDEITVIQNYIEKGV